MQFSFKLEICHHFLICPIMHAKILKGCRTPPVLCPGRPGLAPALTCTSIFSLVVRKIASPPSHVHCISQYASQKNFSTPAMLDMAQYSCFYWKYRNHRFLRNVLKYVLILYSRVRSIFQKIECTLLYSGSIVHCYSAV